MKLGEKGEGMKEGIVGTQGEFQIGRVEFLWTLWQAPFKMTG
jgi:hypothetical protein